MARYRRDLTADDAEFFKRSAEAQRAVLPHAAGGHGHDKKKRGEPAPPPEFNPTQAWNDSAFRDWATKKFSPSPYAAPEERARYDREVSEVKDLVKDLAKRVERFYDTTIRLDLKRRGDMSLPKVGLEYGIDFSLDDADRECIMKELIKRATQTNSPADGKQELTALKVFLTEYEPSWARAREIDEAMEQAGVKAGADPGDKINEVARLLVRKQNPNFDKPGKSKPDWSLSLTALLKATAGVFDGGMDNNDSSAAKLWKAEQVAETRQDIIQALESWSDWQANKAAALQRVDPAGVIMSKIQNRILEKMRELMLVGDKYNPIEALGIYKHISRVNGDGDWGPAYMLNTDYDVDVRRLEAGVNTTIENQVEELVRTFVPAGDKAVADLFAKMIKIDQGDRRLRQLASDLLLYQVERGLHPISDETRGIMREVIKLLQKSIRDPNTPIKI
ncbi:MAG: hypothetical protein EXS55_03295 [Candidatus Magasanikbacteria bacterium]|nr:hypothetical protein [Candidatus Magasanikbacteria bacterium]